MFYAATDNMAIVGYNYNVVAFESKKRRDMFVANEPSFHAETVKDMVYKFGKDMVDVLKMYPEAVHDQDGWAQGMVMFTYGGEYLGIYQA